jgi:sirohydrochlorin ferrochelatase
MAAMNEMLSSTATDFQQTAQDMRLTAQQVVKDIDLARGDLMRALTELPEETRSNADAMRRVVADQIGALSALADVVKRQAGTQDASGPGATTGRGKSPTKN